MADRIHWKRIESALLRYGSDIVEEMRDKLRNAGKNASGKLIESLKAYTEKEDEKLFLYVEIPEYGRKYVDGEGFNWARQPGKWGNKEGPPGKEIREWMQMKGIKPDGRLKGAKTEKQLEFLIRRKIGIRGIPATPFINIFYDNVGELNDIVEESAKEDLENNINNFIKNLK